MSCFFSIIIPVYNTEQYLPRALDPILNQDFDIDKIEVIVVNDRSPKTMQCDEIVERYSHKMKLKYIKNEMNEGTITTRKIGVKSSNLTEGWILFLDPDDYLEVNACNVLYEDIQKNGNTDYIEFDYYELDKNIKEKALAINNTENRNIKGILSFEQNHTLWNKCFNFFFIKNVFEDTESFYACYNTDYYQFGIIEYYTKSRRKLDEYLYVYVKEDGITNVSKYSKEKLKKIFISIHNVEKHLSDFYLAKNCNSYIPIIEGCSEYLYNSCFFRSEITDFFDVYVEVIGIEKFKTFFICHIDGLNNTIKEYQKKMRLLLPIKILIKPFRSFYRFCKKYCKKK